MPNLTYTVSDFQPFTKILSASVNSRFNDIKTLLNTTGLTSSNIQLNGLTRDRLALTSVNQVLINDGTGQMSSEAQLALSRGGTGSDLSALTGKAGKAITVNAGETALSFATPTVDRLTQSFSADIATLLAAETITLNDAVCLDFDNNNAYRVFQCNSSSTSARKRTFCGFATASASVTPQIQTFTTSAALVASNVITYKINGRSYSTTFATSNDATMQAIATQIATDADVSSAVVGGSPIRVITVTGRGGLVINITSAVVTLGASQATITLATTQAYSGQNVQIRCFGLMTGLSGLVAGTYYYVGSGAGTITNAPADGNPTLVGQALSTTTLFVNGFSTPLQFAQLLLMVRSHGSSAGQNSANGQLDVEHFNFNSWSAGTSDATAYSYRGQCESSYLGTHQTIDGLSTAGSVTADHKSYNKTAWSTLTNRATARQGSGVGALSGIFYVGAGSTNTDNTGGKSAVDSWNNSSWSAGVATLASSKIVSGCFNQGSLVHWVGGVNTGGSGVTDHDVYNGSALSTQTAFPGAVNSSFGCATPSSKGIAANSATGSYEWSGSAWSASIAVGYTFYGAGAGSQNPACGFATGYNKAYINGGSSGATTSINTTTNYNGTSWTSDTASSNARSGGTGSMI